MNAIIHAAVHHARTVCLILILLLVTGISTYINIPKESNPDITIPVIYTHVSLTGISPEDAERLLAKPLEQQLKGLEGIKEMTTSAYQGGASITITFETDIHIDQALIDFREKVDAAKAEFPEEADEPFVEEVNLSRFPVLVVALSGDAPERTLYAIAERLKDQLEAIGGVLSVAVKGKREEMAEVIVDPLVLESYQIAEAELINALGRNNLLITAGSIDTGVGKLIVKVPGNLESAQDIMSLPIKADGPTIVRFNDVASIRRVFKDPESYARINSANAVTLEVTKRTGENVIETIDQVKAVIEQNRTFWPSLISVSYIGDESNEVRSMLKDLQNNVISAVLLVVIVIVAAIGVRTASLVAVAIPGSFMIGILALGQLGFTVNIVVLFALILAVGMLVDGAIVVTEYSDRLLADGHTAKEAYTQAAQRMAWPITSSTATTLAAFLPLIFWPGVVGEFMKYLPITLLFTLSASLLMALVFVPTLGGIIGKANPISKQAKENLISAEYGDVNSITGFTGQYIKILSWAISRPLSIFLLIFSIMLLVVAAYVKLGNGTEFFPEVESKQAVVNVRARGDLSIQEADKFLRVLEQKIQALPEIRVVYTQTSFGDSDSIGSIQFEFEPWDERERKADAVIHDIRAMSTSIPGLIVEVQKEESGPGGDEKPIQLAFSNRNASAALETLQNVERWMLEHGGFVDIETNLPLPGIEWQVKVNREQAARFGADVALIGNFIQMVTSGLTLSSFRPDDINDELDINIRFPTRYRVLDQLKRLRVPTEYGYVPIAQFVEFIPAQKVSEIQRLDGQQVFRIKAAVAPLPNEDVVNLGQLASTRLNTLHQAAKQLVVDPLQTQVKFEGQDEDQQESQVFLMNAFSVALFMMGVILVTQFNSFFQAGLVLTAVILSIGGVLLGLLITGQPFGIVMCGVGVISLAGIVVNNNIVLIDTYNILRSQGHSIHNSILRTGALRLRPVMLTTITTILGLMPMVLALNIDMIDRSYSIGAPSTQWWIQLATAVAGGMAFATVLTLILTPCLLRLQDKKWWRSVLRLKPKQSTTLNHS